MLHRDISKEERVQIVDHFTKQLINSGYSWSQSRDLIVSALKGILRREGREKDTGAERYRTGEDSLEDRLRKHLTEATEWYKKGRREEPVGMKVTIAIADTGGEGKPVDDRVGTPDMEATETIGTVVGGTASVADCLFIVDAVKNTATDVNVDCSDVDC